MFTLHTRLFQDTFFIGKLSLCRVLLMNNRNYPWVILVPEREEITEIFQLNANDQKTLIEEISLVSLAMSQTYWPDKMNIGALGNVVEQLHIHIIARFKMDSAWPEPVWGKACEPYNEESSAITAEKIREACANIQGFATIANKP